MLATGDVITYKNYVVHNMVQQGDVKEKRAKAKYLRQIQSVQLVQV